MAAVSAPDASKLHRVEFTLRFPAEEAALQAIAQLEELAFTATHERDDAQDNWVVLASKRMYPTESGLETVRAQLAAIAARGQGTVEGWRATPLE